MVYYLQIVFVSAFFIAGLHAVQTINETGQNLEKITVKEIRSARDTYLDAYATSHGSTSSDKSPTGTVEEYRTIEREAHLDDPQFPYPGPVNPHPPPNNYGPPIDQYGPPKGFPNYGPPILNHPGPAPGYGPPGPAYGPPAPAYGPPAPVYGPPAPVYGPPHPLPNYGVPYHAPGVADEKLNSLLELVMKSNELYSQDEPTCESTICRAKRVLEHVDDLYPYTRLYDMYQNSSEVLQR